ncbi:alpha-amylase-like [Haliotis rubra]|uniref:alpha-amylase-like n=1 Tax=Haliotis rubra TaxID=36100 RepID=UPI001EE598DD|nr:alpha-amylase-like [Haliotis rubra]
MGSIYCHSCLSCFKNGRGMEVKNTISVADRSILTKGDNPNTTCSDLRSYCGGSFKGIEEQLDYIQGLGANAIWISPIIENTVNGYHGYWASNINKVNPEFGTEAELKSLITECHKRDIWVMFDVVANHMGRPSGCIDRSCPTEELTNFTEFAPFDRQEHYHQLCYIQGSSNQSEIEQCRLGILPDLNQSVPYVRQTLLDWVSNLTREYDVDGLRVDTLCEVPKPFWREFQLSAGVFCIGEANYYDRPRYLAAYQGEALDALLNFPMYWALRRSFNDKEPMPQLLDSINLQNEIFIDTTVLGTFVDNHDFQRFLNMTPDVTLLRNALVFVFFSQGIPIVYYGTEQLFHGGEDPDNRESLWPHFDNTTAMYQFIGKLAYARKSSNVNFGALNQNVVYVDNDTLVMTRGDNQKLLIAVTNVGTSQGSVQKSVGNLTDIANGSEFVNIWDSADTAIVNDGVLTISLTNGEPKIFKLAEAAANKSSAISMFMHYLAAILSLCVAVFSKQFAL